jgi:hypothetical protein
MTEASYNYDNAKDTNQTIQKKSSLSDEVQSDKYFNPPTGRHWPPLP